MRMPHILAIVATITVLIWLMIPSQEGDAGFNPAVADPAFRSNHPRIYFDEGHWNIHTANGRYKPFADLLRNDGYDVVSQRGEFTRQKLADFQLLVVANAMGWSGATQQLVNMLRGEKYVHVKAAAFNASECEAVRQWVADGGSLLLISDHAPAGEAAAALSEEFGVGMTNWWAEEPRSHDKETDSWAFLVFSRENGQLQDHAITRGRNEGERLNVVTTFTGQSLRGPEGGTSFLKLSADAREYPWSNSPDDMFRSAANLAQGVALEYGKGRVVVLGEAAVLTSQVARAPGREFHFGLDWPGSDNRQLALNIAHWLTRCLN